MSEPTPVPRVAIAGGGISGMAAALRLAQRGYAVTLYEAKPWLGGNLSSHQDPGSDVYHDVFPHMFSNFYVNFWDIAENDIGLQRDLSPASDFSPRNSVKTLDKQFGYSEFRNLSGMDPRVWLSDILARQGAMTLLDKYLYLYSLLDLINHRFEQRGLLGLDLNAFVRSRPAMTSAVAQLHDSIVMFIWSVHSDATSAASYRSFFRHAFGNVQPLLWLLKGSLQEKIIEPLEQRLLELGCTVCKNTSVDRVVVENQRIKGLMLKDAQFDWDSHQVKVHGPAREAAPLDFLVMAVSPGSLGRLADAGQINQRLSSLCPKLTHAGKRLPAQPIAVMDVYFKRKLSLIPPETVSVTDSRCYFSFTDLSDLWPLPQREGISAITLSASDYWALPSNNERETAHAMLREFAAYITNFDPGSHWGDPDCDIDWGRSHFHSNEDDVIFVNQVGSWAYRPETEDPAVHNLFFAGDFCRNHIDMATVEAAVSSGLNAAAALQAKQPLGEPIVTLEPPVWPHAAVALLKLALAPSAYAVKAWLALQDIAAHAVQPTPSNASNAAVNVANAPRDLIDSVVALASLPAQYLGDMVETAGTIWSGGDDDRRAWMKMWQDLVPTPAATAQAPLDEGSQPHS